METPVIVALVAATASLAVAVWNAIMTNRNQQKLERLKQDNTIELEQLRTQLQRTRADEDARRSYEFEARKRLYTALEPLLFQLTGASESAYVRITELARAARQGKLDGPDDWLTGDDDYFIISTVHRLTAPLSHFRIWQRQLTFVDLGLDPLIAFRFAVCRHLMLSWSQDFALAAAAPAIPYEPPRDPRQGMYIGEVERLADALIVTEGDSRRVMSFGEFESAYRSSQSDFRSAVEPLMMLLHDFHPGTRPVTWRILVAQAHLHRLVIESRRGGGEPLTMDETRFDIPVELQVDFDWRQTSGTASDQEIMEPFSAARSVLLPQLMRTLDTYSR